jgi:hypothetical protein
MGQPHQRLDCQRDDRIETCLKERKRISKKDQKGVRVRESRTLEVKGVKKGRGVTFYEAAHLRAVDMTERKISSKPSPVPDVNRRIKTGFYRNVIVP